VEITDTQVWLVEGVKYNWTILKIYTDEGYTGVGESTNWPGSPIIEAATRHVGERIVGLDPFRQRYIWTKLYRDLNWVGPYGASLCAISGVDMALLDLKAKVLGVPCYELLGGAVRTEIPLYANYWFTEGEHDPDDYARQARAVKEAGFGGLKFDPFAHVDYLYGEDLNTTLDLSPKEQDRAVEVTTAVRETVGPEMDMMIETHAMLNRHTAIQMAQRLAPLGITWYEEPNGPENVDSLKTFRERLPDDVPVTVGERHYTRSDFRPVLENQICDVIMPDITRTGGPTELERIASMAETYDTLIAPHNPNGPLSTLASAHVCAALPNLFRLEFMFNDVPWRDAVISEPLDVQDGTLHVPDAPGLGVDLMEEEIEKHPGVREERDGFYV
jgi:galactonate dehydratase